MSRPLRRAVAGVAGIVAAGAGLASWFPRRFDGVATGEDEQHVAVTEDGWRLALYRYRPRGEPEPHVVVCGHGLAGSRLLYDVRADVSLARHLAEQGFDTWLVDLRGRGASWPTGGPDPALHWSFDDFVWRDLPAAVSTACEVGGHHEAFWLGQEMSGLALYAAAAATTVPQVRGAVTFGSPAFTPSTAQVPGVTSPPQTQRDGRVPFRQGAATAGPLLAYLRPAVLGSSFRGDNTDPWVAATYLRNGVPDESVVLIDQFTDWVLEQRFASRDGVDFGARLEDIALPLLLLVGAADRQRPPDAVRDTYERLGSADKRLVVAGRDAGFSVDYGHDDLLAGIASPREIFPLVADWLRDHR